MCLCLCVYAVFNVGEYRRRVVTSFTCNSAQFFHPDNIEANAIRELVVVVVVLVLAVVVVIVVVVVVDMLMPPESSSSSRVVLLVIVHASFISTTLRPAP